MEPSECCRAIDAEEQTKYKSLTIGRDVAGAARIILNAMSDEDRLSLFQEYCRWCGSDSPRCNCMRDE